MAVTLQTSGVSCPHFIGAGVRFWGKVQGTPQSAAVGNIPSAWGEPRQPRSPRAHTPYHQATRVFLKGTWWQMGSLPQPSLPSHWRGALGSQGQRRGSTWAGQGSTAPSLPAVPGAGAPIAPPGKPLGPLLRDSPPLGPGLSAKMARIGGHMEPGPLPGCPHGGGQV